MKKTFILVTCIVFIVALFLVSCEKKEEAAKSAPAYGDKAPATAGYGEKAKEAVAGYGEKAKEAVAGYGEKATEAAAGYGEKAKEAVPGYGEKPAAGGYGGK